MKQLTPKQEMFCLEYVACSSAVQAYLKAYGCKLNTAQGKAHLLLKQPYIQARLDELMAELSSEAVLTAREVIEELSKIATNGKEAAGNRIKALELLGKHYGLYTDKLQVESESRHISINLTGIDMEERETIDMKEQDLLE